MEFWKVILDFIRQAVDSRNWHFIKHYVRWTPWVMGALLYRRTNGRLWWGCGPAASCSNGCIFPLMNLELFWELYSLENLIVLTLHARIVKPRGVVLRLQKTTKERVLNPTQNSCAWGCEGEAQDELEMLKHPRSMGCQKLQPPRGASPREKPHKGERPGLLKFLKCQMIYPKASNARCGV